MLASIGVFAVVMVAVSSLMGISLTIGYMVRPQRCKAVSFVPFFSGLGFMASLIAIGVLGLAFVLHDFSLQYVIDHSNSNLPLFFRIAAVWGGHEGSLLFWLVTINGWAVWVYQSARQLSAGYGYRFLAVMQAMALVFACFILFASNPFDTVAMVPADGHDLNPMLQDIGLVIHPPLLYFGYVGFAAIFALAFAALLMPEIPHNWFALCRRWNLWAWAWLTLGIVIGSWWAYKELGWGGWWFWDPVENASLLPWLSSLALIHTLIVSERSAKLKFWSFSLAISTFCLSILGTFLIRSGLLTSVHAFALDPTKGLLLLGILSLLLFSAAGLLVWRSDEICERPLSSLWSPAVYLLGAAGLAVLAAFITGLGTFYPMLLKLFGFGSISVGAPYFNQLISPLSALALVLLSMLHFTDFSFRTFHFRRWLKAVLPALLAGIPAGALLSLSVADSLMMTLAVLTLLCQLKACWQGPLSSAVRFLAHAGFVVACLGAYGNSALSFEKSVIVSPEHQGSFAGYQLEWRGNEYYIAPNYTAERIRLALVSEEKPDVMLTPEKRHYMPREVVMSEVAIRSGWFGDFYLTAGEKLAPQTWAVRIQFRAVTGWIWLGAFLMSLAPLAGVVARFRKQHKRDYAQDY